MAEAIAGTPDIGGGGLGRITEQITEAAWIRLQGNPKEIQTLRLGKTRYRIDR